MPAFPPPEYNSYTEARTHLKEILDASEGDQAAKVRRDGILSVVLSGDRLRQLLELAHPAHAKSVVVERLWSIYLPGHSIMADGTSFEDSVVSMIDALREYAEDWHDHLHAAPNHRQAWGLVQLIDLCDDSQLRSWLLEAF